jgi:threonine dehydrogenase-like Zn-dependent dehydrogenase
MLAIQYVKSIPRWLTMRLLGRRFPALYSGRCAVIRLAEVNEPRLPTPEWVKVRSLMSGVCGSDLATIRCEGSPYFSPLTSTPFTLGHEIVGEVVESGQRVVIEPALGCAVRGIHPPCSQCEQGKYAHCENVTSGSISTGIQLGYCRDTGGGWSPQFVAHNSQVHPIPDELSDEEAVLIEPFACALHAALNGVLGSGSEVSLQSKTQNPKPRTFVVLGCGTMGLLTIAALRAIGGRERTPCRSFRVLAVAKHPHQQELAKCLGADAILTPGRNLYEQICERTGATKHQPEIGKPVLLGGVDVTFDCVGSSSSIDDALRLTRAQGKVILVGMPAIPKNVDWTALWHKELQVQGAYAYGFEELNGERVRTFELAIRLMREWGSRLKPLVTHKFALSDYRRAIATALNTKETKSVKTVFELR